MEWELLQEYCAHAGHDVEPEAVEKYDEAYAGRGNSLVDWCYEFLEATGQLQAIPENLRHYFNFEVFARNMEINLWALLQKEACTTAFLKRWHEPYSWLQLFALVQKAPDQPLKQLYPILPVILELILDAHFPAKFENVRD